MAPPFGLASAFSDSHFKQPALARKIPNSVTDMIHRPHYLVGVGSAVIFLSLTHVRERSAERRYVLVCTLRCHVPCGHAASRRSTCGVFHPGTVSSGPNRRLSSP